MASMLFGLAAAGIPVAVHLLHRQRTTPVKWAAMQFLIDSKVLFRRRRRVDHWILMLLRIAAVVALALALAHPKLVDGRYDPLAGAASSDVAVVVDRSLSMGRRAGDASAYEQAASAVEQLATGMRAGDTLSVVLAEHRPQVQSSLLTPARASAETPRRLRETGPGASDGSIADAVRSAREVLADGKNPRKMIVVISDEQRSGWSIDDHAAWQLALGRRQDSSSGNSNDVKVYAMPVTPDAGSASDVAVRDVNIAPRILGPKRVSQISATVMNLGTKPVANVNVALSVDGKSVDARPLASLPAGESRTVQFEHTFADAGSHWLRVQSDLADPLDADNAAVLAVNVLRRLPVLVIDGDLGGAGDFAASQFLRAALQPSEVTGADANALIQPKLVNVAGAASEKLDEYAVVIVNDAPRLPGDLLGRLTDFARDGHGVWFILGPRTDPAFITRDLADTGLFSATLKQPKPLEVQGVAAPPAIDVEDPNHPAVALITAAERNAFSGAATRKWWPLAPQTHEARVILATQTGDPLVLDRPLGTKGGRVALWCTSVDLAWNNWPVLPNFVPLVNETLFHLAAGPTRDTDNRQLKSGQEILWAGPAAPRVNRATMTRPDGTRVDLPPPRLANGRQVISYNETFTPGLYTLQFDQTAMPQPVYFGVGVDPRELDPASLSPSDQKWLADRGFVDGRLKDSSELASAVGAMNPGRDLLPYLAGILLAALVCETLMTWRVARHQTLPEPTEPSSTSWT